MALSGTSNEASKANNSHPLTNCINQIKIQIQEGRSCSTPYQSTMLICPASGQNVAKQLGGAMCLIALYKDFGEHLGPRHPGIIPNLDPKRYIQKVKKSTEYAIKDGGFIFSSSGLRSMMFEFFKKSRTLIERGFLRSSKKTTLLSCCKVSISF